MEFIRVLIIKYFDECKKAFFFLYKQTTTNL